jgi:oligosaccharide reducing-end xylanase
MLNKEERNGGSVVEGVTNVFDERSKLVFDLPNAAAVSYTRPSLEMPAYYTLWAQATGNDFWLDAAKEARKFLVQVAHPTTGLIPQRAYFDGNPHQTYATYEPEAYRVMLNMVLDRIWAGEDAWVLPQCEKVMDFFTTAPVGTEYALDGTVVLAEPEPALVLVNGITALGANTEEHIEFIRAVWEFETPVEDVRYYQGLLQLYALLVLSGRMQIL